MPRDANGRVTSAVLEGSFTLVADQKWKYIDILPDKSQLTSEAQGELPSQTQLNKLTAVHPGVGAEASAAAAYINNSDNVFIVEDMKGNYRVLGNDKWSTKSTVAQDLGQGATGTTSTTISVEATDEVPAPFYVGTIETDDGDILIPSDNLPTSGAPRSTVTTTAVTGPDDGMYLPDDTIKTIGVQNVSIFSEGDLVAVTGIKGYEADGTTRSSSDLILYVRSITDSKIKVSTVNGFTSSGISNLFPAIPSGQTLTIM